MCHTEVSKLSLWKVIYFGDRSSTIVVLGKAQYGQNGRLMRWALVLQQYQFTLRAIKGSENVGADFLSRHSVTCDV